MFLMHLILIIKFSVHYFLQVLGMYVIITHLSVESQPLCNNAFKQIVAHKDDDHIFLDYRNQIRVAVIFNT